jgi:cell wall-associated NlpC family hydrolase
VQLIPQGLSFITSKKAKWRGLLALVPLPIVGVFGFSLSFLPMTSLLYGGYASASSLAISDTGKFPPQILRWQPLVEQIAAKYGLSQYVPLFLAIIYQEVGTSDIPDIMQSSESKGMQPNSIQDPAESVDAGISYFKQLLEKGQAEGDDLASIIQAYNFGAGFLDFIAAHGHKYTVQLAEEFSAQQAAIHGWTSYGNPQYAEEVLAKLAAAGALSGNFAQYIYSYATESPALPTDKYQKLMSIALQFNGWRYVYGGDNPATGFDCSGLTQYVYGQIGIALPRTAQEQWDATVHIPPDKARPGDLVFFANTYNDPGNIVTHVGIYVGNDMMYAANSSGIGYASLDDPFWRQHLYGFGRVRTK